MAIYQYTCRECGHEFKDVEKPDGKEVCCPVCMGDRIEKADVTGPKGDVNSASWSRGPFM